MQVCSVKAYIWREKGFTSGWRPSLNNTFAKLSLTLRKFFESTDGGFRIGPSPQRPLCGEGHLQLEANASSKQWIGTHKNNLTPRI